MNKPKYCQYPKKECNNCFYRYRCKFSKASQIEKDIILGIQETL